MSRKAKHCPICGATPCHWVPNVIETGAMDAYEEIVRCRDCKEFAFGDVEYATVDWCDYWGAYVESPDGYCKWGERRDE